MEEAWFDGWTHVFVLNSAPVSRLDVCFVKQLQMQQLQMMKSTSEPTLEDALEY